MNNRAGKLFVISGPSGSGKTTLAKALRQDAAMRKALARSVSVTTRPARPGEREGRDYFFVSPVAFERLTTSKKILEWTTYLGYYYGTPKAFVDKTLAAGRSLILCLDVRGAARIRSLYRKQAVTIFIKPPSIKTLRERIKNRCAATPHQEICRRLTRAEEEMRCHRQYDYCLVNDSLATALATLKAIITAEIEAV